MKRKRYRHRATYRYEVCDAIGRVLLVTLDEGAAKQLRRVTPGAKVKEYRQG